MRLQPRPASGLTREAAAAKVRKKGRCHEAGTAQLPDRSPSVRDGGMNGPAGGHAALAVSLRYFAPAPPLRPLLSSYYLFEADAPSLCDTLRAELPQVRFVVRGTGTFRYGAEAAVPVPPANLSGPSTVPLTFRAEGPVRLFGAGIRPAGWSAMIGESAGLLADRVVDLVEVAGGAALAAWLRMAEARRVREMIEAADSFFLFLSLRGRPPPFWFTQTADAWLAGSPSPAVDDLVSAVGMSARQVERLCLRLYGAPPKLLARKYRALKAAVRLALDPAGTWRTAAGGAFYDQSHFIREFRTFIGMTPGAFLRADLPRINRLTIAGRQTLADMPPLTRLS